MVSVLSKFIGDGNDKAVKKFRPIAGKVNGLEESVQKLSDSQLRQDRRVQISIIGPGNSG